MRTLHVLLLVLSAAVSPLVAQNGEESGIYMYSGPEISRIHALFGDASVGVLVVSDKLKDPTLMTEERVGEVRAWIEQGGVLWAEGAGLESKLVNTLVRFQMTPYKFRSAETNRPDGALIVRQRRSANVIHDHELTVGVETLWLVPAVRFNGTKETRHLVSMSDAGGQYGVVITSIRLGNGLVVLDGTARRNRMPFSGRVVGFNPDYPNARSDKGTWNSYDWVLLMENGVSYSRGHSADNTER